ncbi:MAG: phosphate acetyltransferase [Xanthomonadales bacterium]|nr:phosphate acetyltransferase [Xanthomonadales bacterium]MCB1611362.1 phosphate acetyltransferase [Xanthomonadales bacterium]
MSFACERLARGRGRAFVGPDLSGRSPHGLGGSVARCAAQRLTGALWRHCCESARELLWARTCPDASARPERAASRQVWTHKSPNPLAFPVPRAPCPVSVFSPPLRAAMNQPKHEKYRALIDYCSDLTAEPCAIVHPCNASSLAGAVRAGELNLIVPILVGPRQRIEAVARESDLDISKLALIDTPHSHASAAKSAELVREGQARMLMKGSLHTNELLEVVVSRDGGLRTERRISHCFVMDVPVLDRVVIISDAAVNIFPTLAEKVDIVQNAINLAHALGNHEPLVAILSATESVNPKIQSTLDAAALCKMADRGQITGGLLDGPLALDNAVNLNAARIKEIDSPVAGRADILIAPDLEAGNMLAKSLSFMADADAAGIVVGARVPIILTSRADSLETRLASSAIAALVTRYRQLQLAKAVQGDPAKG